MRTLCPRCGTIQNPRWRLIPPRCISCRHRLPLTFSRRITYAARTLWRPVFILALAAGLFFLSPYSESYHHTLSFNRLKPHP